MSDLDGLINNIPVADIAKKLGIDESVARTAIEVAVPAIVGGMAANAQSGGAESLASAVQKHEGKSTKLADVDEADGKKIVKNVFGSNTDDVVKAVAAKADEKEGVDFGAIVQQILPIIAPIVLAFLASQMSGGAKKEETKAAEPATGGDIGSILGGLISSPQGQDIVGGLLGGLLGGGRK
jgi:hypothetical protein